MSKVNEYPRCFIKAIKANRINEWDEPHFTKMWVELPREVSHSGDPTAIPVWVAEEFNHTFMCGNNVVACYTSEHVESLLNEVTV